MDVAALLDRITAPGRESRPEAVAALAAAGEPAFDPLVRTLASDDSAAVVWRAERAFQDLSGVDLARYAAALRHPHDLVRYNAMRKLSGSGSAALPFVDDLIVLLVASDEDFRRRVRLALHDIGPGTLPLLRRARRTPGRQRAVVLEALADIGGWDALDTRDQAAVRRLIAVKRTTEKPARMHVCGTWYAVRTTDQAAVLDAFGLSDPEPVTMRLGGSAWNRDGHGSGEHRRCARAYVTPAFSGWTLVFGRPFAHVDPERRAGPVRDLCARLSAEHGAAHFYGRSCGDDWNAWCLAENGEVARYYDLHRRDDWFGGTHPAEAGLLLPHQDPGLPDDWTDGIDTGDPAALLARFTRVKRELGVPDECDATAVAGRTSVDPASFGPGTPFAGHGVLASTACGRAYGGPPGALEI